MLFVVGCWLGAPAHAVPAPTPGTDDFHFQFNRVEVFEQGGVASVVVTRSGVGPVKSSIDYMTADVTAMAGSDYEAAAGRLYFDVGETAKRFTIKILDDNRPEPPERAQIVLTNPQGAVTRVGEPAMLVIVDDDPAERDLGAGRATVTRPPSASSRAAVGGGALTTRAPTTKRGAPAGATARNDGPVVLRTFQLDPPAQPGLAAAPARTVNVGLVVIAALFLGRAASRLWFERRRVRAPICQP